MPRLKRHPRVFSAVDPRGRRVTLNQETWESHIVARHTELVGEEQLVKKAIEQPVRITESGPTFPDREVFELGPVPTKAFPRRRSFVQVAVEWKHVKPRFRGTDTLRGRVVTAYVSPSPRKGVATWPTSATSV